MFCCFLVVLLVVVKTVQYIGGCVFESEEACLYNLEEEMKGDRAGGRKSHCLIN